MKSLGQRSARVSTVVEDWCAAVGSARLCGVDACHVISGANIYNAVWRSVADELDLVMSLREQIDARVLVRRRRVEAR